MRELNAVEIDYVSGGQDGGNKSAWKEMWESVKKFLNTTFGKSQDQNLDNVRAGMEMCAQQGGSFGFTTSSSRTGSTFGSGIEFAFRGIPIGGGVNADYDRATGQVSFYCDVPSGGGGGGGERGGGGESQQIF
ncbi:MAG: hypothetical protein Q4G62_00225 [Pseudomonadota bacterium]|nr:hypothetical protein [Pseudomonadota bacterium]